MAVSVLLTSVVLLLLSYLLRALVRAGRYWADRGVASPRAGLPIIGHSLPVIMYRKSQGELYADLYREAEDLPYFGLYELTRPVLVLKDPALIERVLIKDFHHFVDHGIETPEIPGSVDYSLFQLKGSFWRALRLKLVPAFTSGKLKMMFESMKTVLDSWVDKVDQVSKTEPDIEMKSLISDFALSVIGVTAFGLDLAQIRASDSKFDKMGVKIFHLNLRRYFEFLFLTTFPKLATKFGISFTAPDVAEYFGGILRDTMKYRLENNIHRKDFIQLLLELKSKGHIELTSKEVDTEDDYLKMGFEDSSLSNTESFDISDDVLISQAYVFFTAGFEASSSSVMFVLVSLAENQDIQKKVRAEIKASLAKHGGYSYAALKDMKYLDKVMLESMRIYPLVPFLFRECTKDYTLPDGQKIEQGTKVIIPNLGLHLDPKHYPNPLKFEPDRFEEDASPRSNCTYLPFGDGPRMCIGMRFALVELKLAIVGILDHFQVALSPRTNTPLLMKKNAFILTPRDPVYFKLTRVTKHN